MSTSPLQWRIKERTDLLISTGPPATPSRSSVVCSFLRPFLTSNAPFFPPRASTTSWLSVSFVPDWRTASTTFRICHVANVTSRGASASRGRMQLSQCPQGSSAPVSSVVHAATDSCDECEKYLRRTGGRQRRAAARGSARQCICV